MKSKIFFFTFMFAQYVLIWKLFGFEWAVCGGMAHIMAKLYRGMD